MEKQQFDALTRQWGTGEWSRRWLARALAAGLLGSAAGSAATALGLTEVAAKRKHRKKKRHKNNTQSPQEPQACGDDERRCPDDTCVSQGSCCADQRACGDGSCIAPNQCCPDADPPTCGDCQAAVCEDGELVCRSTCEEGFVCCNGHCVGRCTGGAVINPATCLCECPSETELMADSMTCCPSQRACGRKGNDARLPTVCCAELDHCCDDFDICVGPGSACE